MPIVVGSCAHVLIGGYEFSADFTSLQVNYESEQLDMTTFGSLTKKNKGGLRTTSIDGKGFLNLGSSQNDPILFGFVAQDGVLATVFPTGINVGSSSDADAGWGLLSESAKFDPAVNMGQLIPIDISLQAQGQLVPATPLENFLTCVFSTGANTGGAIFMGPGTTCADKTYTALFAGLHVTAISTGLGASNTAIIQAASSSGFGSSTTVVTFSAQSTKGAQYATPVLVSALSTDRQFYRSRITVSTGSSTGATSNGLIWMGWEDVRIG